MSRRFVLGLIISGLIGLGPAPVAGAEQASLPDIEDEVMCPICGTILEASNSPQAEREREFIRAQIAQGKSKQEIQDALVAEYGPDVLAVPDSKGFDLVAWVVPILGLVVAVGLLGAALWRIRRKPIEETAAVNRVGKEENDRIDREIGNSDL
ncbi:MAG: cytochrome c-type biogenesis protein CcmH [bacterium]